MLLCKQKALYVKCCIIANGVTDSQGDTLYNEDIKKIFTSFNNQDNFEVYHDELPLQEVSLLENYISTADETIGTSVVPSGSWNAVIRVDNPTIKEGLLTGKFGGVSLNNRIAPRCKGNLKGTIRYKDVADAECVIPLLISFVKGGANGYGLHVMDYDAYIKKSKDIEFENENGGNQMDFKEFLTGLKSLIKEAEDAPEEEVPAIEKDDETNEEEVETSTDEPVEEETEESAEEPADETEKEEDNEGEVKIIKDDEEATETEEETTETEIIKDDNGLEERVAKLEEQLAELLAAKEDESEEEENPDSEDEPEDKNTPKITKSEKVIIGAEPVKQNNYYDITGRDPLSGKKIRR